jgi:hypothetical protein
MMQNRPDPGEAMYVKPMTGFNMSGGYNQAQPWEQGAVFAGYRPRGSGPQSASFAGRAPTPLASQGEPTNQPAPGTSGYYEGGGALGPGADFARDRMQEALARSNKEYAQRQQGGG